MEYPSQTGMDEFFKETDETLRTFTNEDWEREVFIFFEIFVNKNKTKIQEHYVPKLDYLEN